MKNKGTLYAVGAYLIWGFMPVYLKQVQSVPPIQILFHRIVWSFVLLGIVILIRGEGHALLTAGRDRRVIVVYLGAACLLGVNWLSYIWGVNSGQIVETSLGYYINPLVSVALSVIFLRERLRPFQWAAIGLAAAGVLYLTIQYGRLPWLALVIALSFGFYGLVKKLSPLGSLHGLTLETSILFLPALAMLVALQIGGSGVIGKIDLSASLFLIGIGVITAVPLLLFASAARRIPLSMMGVLQYLSPTLQFLLGVLVYQEPFSTARLVGFVLVWLALLIYWLEGILSRRAAGFH